MNTLYRILFVALVFVLGANLPVMADAPRGFIGDAGSGWDTSGTVSTRTSYNHTGTVYLQENTINGSGLNAAGEIHDNVGANMWKAWSMVPDPDAYGCDAEYCGKSRYTGGCGGGGFGQGPGNSCTWIEYDLGSIVQLGDMWIWNYTEGDLVGYAWSSMGMQKIQIHVATSAEGDPDCPSYGWGSSRVADWTLVYDGELDCYNPGDARDAQVIDAGSVSARYVVITAAPDHHSGGTGSCHDLNWTEEKRAGTWTDGSGISEVRFYPDVYTSPTNCSEAIQQGYNRATDFSGDCFVNLLDLAMFMSDWLRCIDPTDEDCERPWE